MSRFLFSGFVLFVTCAAPLALAPSLLGAQQPAQHAAPATREDSIAAFARTHLDVSALRDRYQAEFAEPQNKKREVQDALHEKFQEGVQALLTEHGFTEAEYTRLTRLVSVDSSARRLFEEVLAREAKE